MRRFLRLLRCEFLDIHWPYHWSRPYDTWNDGIRQDPICDNCGKTLSYRHLNETVGYLRGG